MVAARGLGEWGEEAKAKKMRKSQPTFRGSLLAVRLHGDVCVEMVQSAIGLLTSIPAALVHALDFLIASTRALVLLSAGDRNERVNLFRVEFTSVFVLCASKEASSTRGALWRTKGVSVSSSMIHLLSPAHAPTQLQMRAKIGQLNFPSRRKQSLFPPNFHIFFLPLSLIALEALANTMLHTYLARSLLRSRRWGLSVDGVAGSQRRSSMLAVPGPVGSGLRIHASALMGVAMRHVWIRRIRRVLPIRVGWTRSRNRRIYRHIVVRIDGVGLMARPIVLGHRRTVLLLRHTSAARAAGRMV